MTTDDQYTYIEFMRKFFPNDSQICPECGKLAFLAAICQRCRFEHKSWRCDCGWHNEERSEPDNMDWLITSHAMTILKAFGVTDQ